jgi:hypothetical protein
MHAIPNKKERKHKNALITLILIPFGYCEDIPKAFLDVFSSIQ